MKVIFDHRKKSDNLYNRFLFPLFIFPIIGMLYLWGLEIDVLIKIIGSIFLLMISISFYRNTPYKEDHIILTEDKMVILKNNRRQTILIEEIKSISSTSKLSVKMKNGNVIVLKYSDWMLGLQKVRTLNLALNKLTEKNISGKFL